MAPEDLQPFACACDPVTVLLCALVCTDRILCACVPMSVCTNTRI